MKQKETGTYIISMDELLEQCATLTLQEKSPCWYNNTVHGLYCVQTEYEDYVYASSHIYAGNFIGYITGERKYTWEILPHKYCIWLNDSYVIDCRESPRCITSMIRETMDPQLQHNCELAFAYTNDTVDVYVIAVQDIYRGEELVMKKDCMEEYG